MIKELIPKWDEVKSTIKEELGTKKHTSYDQLFRILIRNLTSQAVEDDAWPVTEHQNGSYQGLEVLLGEINGKTYYTVLNYGSCSACDALEKALLLPEQAKRAQLFQIVLHMFQNLQRIEDPIYPKG